MKNINNMNKYAKYFTEELVRKALVSRAATIGSTQKRAEFLNSIGINTDNLQYKDIHYYARMMIKLLKIGTPLDQATENILNQYNRMKNVSIS